MAVVYKYRGATACQVTGIDKQRFNEAVASGRYPCAPTVRKGGTRTFTEDDIIALFVYARLIEQEIPPRVAGDIACAVRSKLEEDPSVEEIRIPRYSEIGTHPPSKAGDEFSVHVHMSFDIAGIRAAIAPTLKRTREGNI